MWKQPDKTTVRNIWAKLASPKRNQEKNKHVLIIVPDIPEGDDAPNED